MRHWSITGTLALALILCAILVGVQLGYYGSRIRDVENKLAVCHMQQVESMKIITKIISNQERMTRITEKSFYSHKTIYNNLRVLNDDTETCKAYGKFVQESCTRHAD